MSNLITLCAHCHSQVHRTETDQNARLSMGGGPTILGSAVATVTGPLGRLLGRLVDTLSLALIIVLGALMVSVALPNQSVQQALTPLQQVLAIVFRSPRVALVWTVSLLGTQSLLAIQPFVHRLSPDDVPSLPVGQWDHWLLLGFVLLVGGSGGLLALDLEYFRGVQPVADVVFGGCYGGGLATTLLIGTLSILNEGSGSARATSRWRRLSVLTGSLAVGGLSLSTALFTANVSLFGLFTPVLAFLFVFRPTALVQKLSMGRY